jgi:arylesterase/paraoxonase
MGRLSGWFSAAALLLFGLAIAAYLTLDTFRQFSRVDNAFEGSCTPVNGIAGPEDVQIDPATRRAFISSFDMRQDDGTKPRGAIYAFNISDPLDASSWKDRTLGKPRRFEPHGIYLYQDERVSRLFVVNAATRGIELYDITKEGDLVHLETIAERRLTSPNDIVAVGPRAFYVTNDSEPGRETLLGRLYFLLRAGSGSVLYFDGETWRVSADGLRFANGLAVNPAGNKLYVAETSGGTLRIFDRDVETGALTATASVPIDGAPDNLNFDRSGSLWIAAHPKPLSLPGYFRNPEGRSPSLVMRYDDVEGGAARPIRIYANDGRQISASSAAARFGSTLIIGALLDTKFLICTLPD